VKVDELFYRPAEVELLIGDSSRAREMLGWQPRYDFGALVDEMVDSDIAALADKNAPGAN